MPRSINGYRSAFRSTSLMRWFAHAFLAAWADVAANSARARRCTRSAAAGDGRRPSAWRLSDLVMRHQWGATVSRCFRASSLSLASPKPRCRHGLCRWLRRFWLAHRWARLQRPLELHELTIGRIGGGNRHRQAQDETEEGHTGRKGQARRNPHRDSVPHPRRIDRRQNEPETKLRQRPLARRVRAWASAGNDRSGTSPDETRGRSSARASAAPAVIREVNHG